MGGRKAMSPKAASPSPAAKAKNSGNDFTYEGFSAGGEACG